jgi:hypothetical protein
MHAGCHRKGRSPAGRSETMPSGGAHVAAGGAMLANVTHVEARKPTRSSRRWIRTRGSTGLDPDPWVGSGFFLAGSLVGSGPVGPLAGRILGWIRIRGSAADRILSWIRARGSIGGSDPGLDPGRARLRPCRLCPGASALPPASASRPTHAHWPSPAEAPGAYELQHGPKKGDRRD